LPATIADVAVGGGGRYLVLHLPQQRKLAVFDINEAKVAHYITAADDNVQFAASLDKLIVVLGNTRIMQRWNLHTGERELSLPLPVNGVVKTLALGSASNGPLLLHWAVGTGALDDSPTNFIDIQTLKLLDM